MVRAENSVRSVERALDILQLVAASASGAGLTEIAGQVRLPKSTVYRLLATLEARGFVRRDAATEHFHLGLRALDLASRFFEGDDLTGAALPEMQRLRDQVDETVSLYVRDDQERVRVQKVESRQAVRRVVQIGQRSPLYIGASGKVLLAYSDSPTFRQVIEGLPERFDKDNLLRQLDRVRQDGYAVSIEEREIGTSAVAAPVFNRAGAVVAALCVSGPSNRFDRETIALYGQAVAEGARRLSGQMN